MTLTELIVEATMLAGAGHPCHTGHVWESEGGRRCPRGSDNCSQTVYRCARCDEYDYGDPGGPGHADCERPCDLSCEQAEEATEELTNELMEALL